MILTWQYQDFPSLFKTPLLRLVSVQIGHNFDDKIKEFLNLPFKLICLTHYTLFEKQLTANKQINITLSPNL